jgi:hypothetical protein
MLEASRRFGVFARLVWVALLWIGVRSEPAQAQTTPFEYRSAGMVHDTFTFDGGEVWTVEDGGRIRHRSSAGGAWQFEIVPTPVNTMLRHVHFVPDSTPADGPTGWAVGDDGWIIKTTNGGTTWMQTNFDSTHAQVRHSAPGISQAVRSGQGTALRRLLPRRTPGLAVRPARNLANERRWDDVDAVHAADAERAPDRWYA